MSEEQEQYGIASTPDEKIAAIYAQFQSTILLAVDNAKALIKIVSQERDLKAVSAVTKMKHRTELLALETMKFACLVMDPINAKGAGK